MEEQRRHKDTTFAIIAIVAGLLTGAVLTWAFLQPEEEARYTPEYRVAESQRVPYGSAEAAEESPGGDAEAEASDGADGEDRAGGEGTAADRATVRGARERMREEGVAEYVEIDDEVYVRVSAKMVIAAAVLNEALGPGADPEEAERLLADSAATELARAGVDPDEFAAYTEEVRSDPERAMEMAERILREAEKHTEMKITFDNLPADPLPGAEGGGE